jgi:hypothetical protein
MLRPAKLLLSRTRWLHVTFCSAAVCDILRQHPRLPTRRCRSQARSASVLNPDTSCKGHSTPERVVTWLCTNTEASRLHKPSSTLVVGALVHSNASSPPTSQMAQTSRTLVAAARPAVCCKMICGNGGLNVSER